MRDDDIASERSGGVLVVEMCGEPGIRTVLAWASLLETALCELPSPRSLVIDLGSLGFLTARGVRGLLSVFEVCRKRGISGCLIVSPGGDVERVVRLTGLAGQVPVFPHRLLAVARYQPAEMRWLLC
ncbi:MULTISPECIES: STAS domain-containing protein [unclassified Amycolatopsis]|uniref:STAS domain-containing protein n=1 Tax=unclassified Amycolatopsis TaxID=2618356 RepID=UPI0028752E5C|nr:MULTISPECIES: STAS domain-containing protein [unclassified Amycolatopsis]MDS0135649.1 STAS domain-containing protein [Amycolatopsis sp. 505]MDS0148335.1 STAS domain-containing protein [Amycolatopsis sp. CM201R]